MSLNDKIDDNALWARLEQLQKELEQVIHGAVTTRKLSAFGPMAALLKEMHWAAAFLGLTDFADITAMGAAFVNQLQESRYRWSVELTAVLKTLLKRNRDFLDARPKEPSAGVFIDSQSAVLQGTGLKRPVPTGDLTDIFRRRQINKNLVSPCRQLTVGQDRTFSHAISVPAFARKRHRSDRYLSMVYIDLDQQELDLEKLSKTLDEAFGKSEILLHGPLGIPWKNYQTYKAKKPYYLLLDTEQDSQKWLNSRDIKGKTVKILNSPEIDPSNEPRVIIREVVSPGMYKTPGASAQAPAETEYISDLKPAGRRKKSKIKNRNLGIKFPVGAKLILIVSTIIILSMSTLAYLSIYFFKGEIRNQVEDTNISLSQTVAKQAEKEIEQFFDLSNLLFQVGSAAGGTTSLIDDFFYNYQSLVYVGVPGSNFEFANRDWFRDNRISDERAVLNNIMSARAEDLEKARSGETVVVNVSPFIPNLKAPVIALAAPFLLGSEQKALVILADIGDSLAESVSSQKGKTTTVIINSQGEMLAHPDFTRVFNGDSLRDSPVFQKMYSMGLTEGQIHFQEETINGPVKVMGSFKLIPVGNLGVVTTVLEKDAFSVVRSIQILNWSLLAAVLSLAVLAVFFFSQGITRPLKELTLATRMIKAQNYAAISIEPKTSDEVGQLTRNFMEMVPHLQARERLREKTEAFINKQVAEMIDSDTLPDHAETKNVTVFFSDVRGFTGMSEKMGDPQVVLDNLSEYFSAMVPCVEATRGTVDKFIGDAVMAVWGSMQDLPNNAESAIEGALMMRDALRRFNTGRGGISRPFFQIGCGLNSGPATVGLMGDPNTKMEWAHMGDTVNLASRIEALNKPMGTDILISQNTADKVKGIYHLVPMNKIKVKGKAEPQQIYAVLGRMDDESRPRTLKEMRTIVGIRGDFNNVSDSEEHEVKYEILDS